MDVFSRSTAPSWLFALAATLGSFSSLIAAPSPTAAPTLPRFTEEREAAELFFVKKHVPEIVPLLEQLKKTNRDQYQQEVREIFQVTEFLADLQDEPRRHDLELKIWTTENKAYALVAKLSTNNGDDRKQIEGAIHDLARDLVHLDIQVLELKAEQLDKELGEVKDELAKSRNQIDKQTRSRYEALLEQAKKRKKA
jgi:hypothetical protein